MSKKKSAFGQAPIIPKFKRAGLNIGEDLPALKRISKEIQGQNVTIEDFILLVGPHTGDKGAVLTKVMNEDLTSFRKMVTKVYDTMTKDASDVMANTQIELGQLYSERQRQLVDNMLRSLQTIKDYVPDFDFQLYFEDPDKYLGSLFKLADIPDEEEIEAARRQLAYHRLQWLQSEGERLQAENTKLEERLNELKKIKRKQIMDVLNKERDAEKQRIQLEQKEEEMQNELEELSDELHEAIITEEKKTIDTKKEKAVKILAKKPKAQASAQIRKLKAEWNVKVAGEYSKAQIQGETAAETSEKIKKPRPTSAASTEEEKPPSRPVSKSSKTRVKRKKKPVPIHARPGWQDVDVDEFIAGGASEVRGPRGQREEEVPIDILSVGTSRGAAARPAQPCPTTCSSSPPRTARVSPEAARAPSETARASPERARAPPQAARAPPEGPRGRNVAGPRDSWGGFG